MSTKVPLRQFFAQFLNPVSLQSLNPAFAAAPPPRSASASGPGPATRRCHGSAPRDESARAADTSDLSDKASVLVHRGGRDLPRPRLGGMPPAAAMTAAGVTPAMRRDARIAVSLRPAGPSLVVRERWAPPPRSRSAEAAPSAPGKPPAAPPASATDRPRPAWATNHPQPLAEPSLGPSAPLASKRRDPNPAGDRPARRPRHNSAESDSVTSTFLTAAESTSNCTIAPVENDSLELAGGEWQVERFLREFGLFVGERDEKTRDVTWVVCKFCVAFGCSGRNKDYLKAYAAPFWVSELIYHLKQEHHVEWGRFRVSSMSEKAKFFDRHELPSAARVKTRLDELKAAWGLGLRGRSKKKRVRTGAGAIRLVLETSKHKRPSSGQRTETHVSSPCEQSTVVKDASATATGETTRRRVRTASCTFPTETLERPLERGQVASAHQRANQTLPGVKTCDRHESDTSNLSKLVDYVGRMKALPPSIIRITLHGALSDEKVRHTSGNREMALPQRESQSGAENRRSIWTRNRQADQTFCGFVLSYLLQGVSIDRVSGLIDGTRNRVRPTENGFQEGGETSATVSRIRAAGAICPRDAVIELTDDNDSLSYSDALERRSLAKEAWNVGNTICAEGLYCLSCVLTSNAAKPRWALALALLPCSELSEYAAEVMLPYADRDGNLKWSHLASVRNHDSAGEAIVGLLDSVSEDWRMRLTCVKSRLPAGIASAQELQTRILGALRREARQEIGLIATQDDGAQSGIRSFGQRLLGVTGRRLGQLLDDSSEAYLRSVAADTRGMKRETLRVALAELSKVPETAIHSSVQPARAVKLACMVVPEAKELVSGLSAAWSMEIPIATTRNDLPRVADMSSGMIRSEGPIDVLAERTFWARGLYKLLDAVDFEKRRLHSRLIRDRSGSWRRVQKPNTKCWSLHQSNVAKE